MNVDITNHLLPWAIVKGMLKGAWDEGHDAGWKDAHNTDTDTLTPNPYQEDE